MDNSQQFIFYILLTVACTSMDFSRASAEDILNNAKESILLSKVVLNNLIHETMPGSLSQENEDENHTHLRGTVLPILSELASVQISYEREITMNENSSDYVLALNEVLKHTIQSTCTWVQKYLNESIFDCSPESIKLIKIFPIIGDLNDKIKNDSFGPPQDVNHYEYQEKILNCDNSIDDNVKQTVANLSYTSDHTIDDVTVNCTHSA